MRDNLGIHRQYRIIIIMHDIIMIKEENKFYVSIFCF